jgi:hypothetical protein
MSITPASRGHSILIAEAAVSIVITACASWRRLYVRTDREGASDRVRTAKRSAKNEGPA